MQELLLGQKQEKSNDLGFTAVLVIILFAFYLIMVNVYSLVIVNGKSMEHTLTQGDVLFVNQLANYERGDVIVFNIEGNMLIKRVIAVEGDEIKCENGVVCIKYNGEGEFIDLNEQYIETETRYIPHTVLKEGELFVLGDNRPISNDSSSFGPIKKDCVTGVVTEFSIKYKNVLSKLFSWAFVVKEFED